MSKAPDFQSLYEYLGDRPAGPALGYAIATRAKIRKEPVHPRPEPASPYNRPINTYRVAFLDNAFNDPSLKEIIMKDAADYKKKRQKKTA